MFHRLIEEHTMSEVPCVAKEKKYYFKTVTESKLSLSAILIIIFISGFVIAGQANADTHTLFRVTLNADNQSSDLRQEKFMRGMLSVLKSLSGDTQIEHSQAIGQAVKNATQYVVSFSYSDIPISQLTAKNSDTASVKTRFALHIDFDPNAIIQLLKKQHFPVWLSTRPPILVWLVQKNKDNNISISSSNSPLGKNIIQSFSALNMSANFPIMDVQDISAISPLALWNLNKTAVLTASKRYNTPPITVIRIDSLTEGSDIFNGSITVYFQGKTEQHNFPDTTPDLFSDTIASIVIKMMANFYNIDNKKNQSMHITIRNVDTFKKYIAVSNYLKKQALIQEVVPILVTADTVEFQLTLKSGREHLTASLLLDQHLIKENTPAASTPVNSAKYNQDEQPVSLNQKSNSIETPASSPVYHWVQ